VIVVLFWLPKFAVIQAHIPEYTSTGDLMVARMTKTFPRSNRTERKWHVCQELKRLGWGQKFIDHNFVLRDPADPYVAGLVRSDGTPIPRLKPVPPVPPAPRGGFFPEARLDSDAYLNSDAYAVEFYSEDVAALFEALEDCRRGRHRR
jgi:hypothetical protein